MGLCISQYREDTTIQKNYKFKKSSTNNLGKRPNEAEKKESKADNIDIIHVDLKKEGKIKSSRSVVQESKASQRSESRPEPQKETSGKELKEIEELNNSSLNNTLVVKSQILSAPNSSSLDNLLRYCELEIRTKTQVKITDKKEEKEVNEIVAALIVENSNKQAYEDNLRKGLCELYQTEANQKDKVERVFKFASRLTPQEARIALYNGLSYNPSKNFVARKEEDLNLSFDE